MNIFLVILVALLAFSAGLNIGRLATLWQFGEEDKARTPRWRIFFQRFSCSHS